MSDHELVVAWVRRRDPDAFRQLCDSYAGLAYHTGLRLLRNGADAEEIAQECFLRLARLRSEISGSVAAWIHRVAVNLSIDRIRAEAARSQRERRYAENRPQTAETTWNDLREHIDAAINTLPDKQRRALIGHFIEGRSQHELALAEGISRASIHERIHRGLHEVRNELRRRGVLAGAGTLAAILADGFAEASAVPAALARQLGTLTVYAGAAQSGTFASLGSLLTGRLAWMLAAGLLAAGGAVYMHYRAPADNTENPVEAVAETPVSNIEVADATLPPNIEAGPDTSSESPTTSELEPAPDSVVASDPALADGITLEGYVREHETARPLEGVGVVWAVDDGTNRTTYSDEDVSKTDGRGRYRIPHVMPGRGKVLCISKWTTRDPGDARPYVVELRFTGNASLKRLHVEGSGIVAGPDFDAIVGKTVSGRVVDADGVPVAEAEVRLHAESTQIHVLTVADGTFKGGGFPLTDRFYTEATKGDMGSILETVADPAALTSGPIGPLTVGNDGLQDLVLVMQRGAAVRGRLLNEHGAPVSGAHVMARTGANPDWAGSRYGTTREDGSFAMSGLAQGTYELGWNPRNENEPEDMYGWTPSQAEILAKTTLAWGDDRSGFVLRTMPPERGLAVVGRVVNGRGMPVSDANISARRNGIRESKRTVTAKDGSFTVTGLEEGQYQFQASHPEYAHQTVEVDIPAQGPIAIALPDYVAVSGRVVYGDTGNAATAFTIGAQGQTQGAAFNDADGRFRLDGVNPGKNVITATADGFATTNLPIELPPGRETKNVIVTLNRGATLEGTVVTDRGDPVAGALIFTRNVPEMAEQREATAEARTDGRGAFRLENLARMNGHVTAWHQDYPVSGATYDAKQTDVEIVLCTRTGTITGHVTADGEPIANARVELGSPVVTGAGAYHAEERTTQDGHFSFDRVPQGTHEIHTYVGEPVNAMPPRNLTRELEVTADQETVVDLELPPVSSSIEGRVTYRGAPPASGWVMAQVGTPQGRQVLMAELDADGKYRIVGSPSGTAHLTVSAMTVAPFTSVTRRIHLDVQPEVSVQHDVAFDGEGRVGGRITGGAPDKQIVVRLMPGHHSIGTLDIPALTQSFQETVAQTMAGPDGDYTFDSLPDGDYTVIAHTMASQDVGAWGSTYCAIANGNAAEVDLTIR